VLAGHVPAHTERAAAAVCDSSATILSQLVRRIRDTLPAHPADAPHYELWRLGVADALSKGRLS
jgi:hypothetical protein